MRRESTAAKAARYLSEGRVVVDLALGDRVLATAHGDSGDTYRLGHHPDTGWSCTCAAYRECAHLKALKTVTVKR